MKTEEHKWWWHGDRKRKMAWIHGPNNTSFDLEWGWCFELKFLLALSDGDNGIHLAISLLFIRFSVGISISNLNNKIFNWLRKTNSNVRRYGFRISPTVLEFDWNHDDSGWAEAGKEFHWSFYPIEKIWGFYTQVNRVDIYHIGEVKLHEHGDVYDAAVTMTAYDLVPERAFRRLLFPEVHPNCSFTAEIKDAPCSALRYFNSETKYADDFVKHYRDHLLSHGIVGSLKIDTKAFDTASINPM